MFSWTVGLGIFLGWYVDRQNKRDESGVRSWMEKFNHHNYGPFSWY